jgi:serine/threonine protein kinase
MDGGKLVDQGQYGCIFKPPLICKDAKKQPVVEENEYHPPISKLIKTEFAKTELSVSKRIMQIPEWKNYFSVAESMCEPAIKQKESQLSTCEAFDENEMTKYRILFMHYAGEALDVKHFIVEQFDFMHFMKHLIEAGALLNLTGIIHRDIHHGNILVDANDIPRIIDFNLTKYINEVKQDETMYFYEDNYDIYHEPPDSTLVHAIGHRKYGYKVAEYIAYKKPVTKKIQALFGISSQSIYADLKQFIQKSRSVRAGDKQKWFLHYWRTVDSWAIGTTLVYTIMRFISNPIFANLIRKNRAMIMKVVKPLCAFSPLDRIDCVQALALLEPTNYIVKRYGKEWLDKVGSF